jgi:mono/diheme cytochrome c family protein
MSILMLCFVGIFSLVYFLVSYVDQTNASVSLKPNEREIVLLGKNIYLENCASCHGKNLQGQANWRQRDAEGYLPAPPHDKDGHTWHHPDEYLFSMTKYGIERMIGEKYQNKMPAYETILSDKQIIAALSYIKSTWPRKIQRQHDRLNKRSSPNKN